MRILIVGAGIAGLSLAAQLQKYGERPLVIEKRKTFQDSGYVFGIWSIGFRTLQLFQIAEKIKNRCVTPQLFQLKDKNGKLVKQLEIEKSFKKYGYGIFLLRKDFHRILLRLNIKTKIRYGISIKNIKQQKESVSVEFNNGKKENFDLVVGADGMHSQVRELIFGKEFLRPYGIAFWVCLLPKKMMQSCWNPEITWNKNTFVGMYPYRNGRACLFFGVTQKRQLLDSPHTYSTVLKNHFSEYGETTSQLLNSLRHHRAFYHGEMLEVTLKNYYSNRVVLIGDAAHGMIATTGMGVSMALEDAYLLAKELHTGLSIPHVLASYNQKRKKRILWVRLCTNFIGWLVTEENKLVLRFRNMFCTYLPNWIVMRILNYLLSRSIE